MCPIITWQHSNAGAIATVQVQWYQLSFYQICFTCYCKFQEVRKMNVHSYYTNRQIHLGTLTWKLSMLVEIQFDKSSFELRSSAVQSFLGAHVNTGHRGPAGLPLTRPTTNPGSTSAMTSADHGGGCHAWTISEQILWNHRTVTVLRKKTDITRFHIVYCSW